MTDGASEIAALRAEVAGLREALSHVLAMSLATGEAAQSLYLLHPDPIALGKTLHEVRDAGDAELLFSQGTEENLKKIENAREVWRGLLRTSLQRRSQGE